MDKWMNIFVLIVVLGLVFMQIQNKALIKQLQVKLDEVGEQCVVARDVEPMIIIAVPEEN
jgi:hypothetical protein